MLFTGLVLLLSCFFGMGYDLFSNRPDAGILELWLPPKSYRQRDEAVYGQDWGAQHVEQLIVEPAEGAAPFLSPLNFDKTTLLAAFDLFAAAEALTSVAANSSAGVVTAYDDVCYKPAAPFDGTCLGFSPFDWWARDRATLVADESPWLTVGAVSAAGSLDGMTVRRQQVWGGVTESLPGNVSEVKALMLWVFVDVAPDRVNGTSDYAQRVDDWERAFLDFAAAANANSSIPLKVIRNIHSSTESAIQSGVDDDMLALYFAIVGVMVLAIVSFFLLNRKCEHGWRLSMATMLSLGLTIGAQMGAQAWAEELGLVVAFGGVKMMLFLTITLGILHRALLLREVSVREVEFSFLSPARLAAVALPLLVVETFVFGSAFGVCCVLSTTEGMRAYCCIAALGFPLELIAVATLDMPCVALLRRDVQRRSSIAVLKRVRKVADSAADIDVLGGYGDLDVSTISATSAASSSSFSQLASEQTQASLLLTPSSSSMPLLLDAYTSNVQEQDKKNNDVCACCMYWPDRAIYACAQPLRAAFVLLALAGCIVVAALGVRFLDEGWTADVTTARLVPESSYTYEYATVYDAYFANNAVPIDFPLIGIDFGDPRNGPRLQAAAAILRASPIMNGSEFRDWYSAFIEYCSGSTLPVVGCAGTMQDGFPTNSSFNLHLLLFIADAKYQPYAADLQLSGISWTGKAKFGGNSADGVIADYTGQRDFPTMLRNLSLTASAAIANASRTTDMPANLFGFTGALPYLEQWGPSRNDLKLVVFAISLAALFGAVMILDAFGFMIAAICALGASCSVVLYMALAGWDFNLATIPIVLLTVPVAFDTILSVAYRFLSRSLRLWYDDTGTGAQRIVAGTVLLPALAAVGCSLTLGTLPMLGCASPLNTTFLYAFDVAVVSTLVIVLCIVMPAHMWLAAVRWRRARSHENILSSGDPYGTGYTLSSKNPAFGGADYGTLA